MQNKIIVLLTALTALIALAGCGGGESEAVQEEQSQAIRVEVASIAPITLEDVLTLPGATSPDADVCVSSESTGTVIWLNAKEGEWVQKGQLLARLDTKSSGARFDKAKAARKLAAEQVRRRRELLEKGVLAQEEFDRMESELRQTEASLKEMQVDVEYGVVRAPIAGVINKRFVDRGERLNAGDKVVDIVNPAIIRTTINVPEMDIPFVTNGQEVTVTVDAIPGRTWKGIVDFVSYKASEASKTFEVRVLTDNADGKIRAGMLARVSLLRRSLKQAVTIPLHTIINQGGERRVFVEEDGIARARTIELGIIGTERAEVTEGLLMGEKLIVSGQSLVEDGMKVDSQ